MLWNEGRLPEGFTIETLLGKHPSRPYNKNIANVFFKAGFIEAWGRGIAKIVNGFTNAGLSAPVFQTTMGGIMLTIERGIKAKVTVDVTDDVTDRVTDKVTDRLSKILHHISSNNKITTVALAKELGVSKRTILRDIERLKNDHKLHRKGDEKTGYWEVREQ